MTPLPVIILILVFVSDFILGTEYQDCTSIFKNRVALFEYKYYPGYWSYPHSSQLCLYLGYNRNLEDAKANNLYHWTLHDCGNVPAFQESWLVDYASDNSTLCIQSNSETNKGPASDAQGGQKQTGRKLVVGKEGKLKKESKVKENMVVKIFQ